MFGCQAVPVHQNFPDVPVALQEPAPQLALIPDGATASDTFGVIIDNYGTYYTVAAQLAAWQKWYAEQRKIFDSVE
jgi:hypothetical protein